MSAFIVSKKHIDVLITSLKTAQNRFTIFHQQNAINFDTLDEIGQILVNQNYESVNFRYNENAVPYKYEHKAVSLPEIVQILKLCDCYDYESCETDDYEQTLACNIINTIRINLISKLPGYDEAEWEI